MGCCECPVGSGNHAPLMEPPGNPQQIRTLSLPPGPGSHSVTEQNTPPEQKVRPLPGLTETASQPHTLGPTPSFLAFQNCLIPQRIRDPSTTTDTEA